MLYGQFLQAQKTGKKLFTVLIDPDKDYLPALDAAIVAGCDFILVGGSMLLHGTTHATIEEIKKQTDIPVLLFPGSAQQVAANADGILLLSLISGRNPEYLIGQHVVAAPAIKSAGLEVIPTGYMLVGNNNTSSVSYVSNTTPIPEEKTDIACATALAGEMLGMKQIYLEAGSGATNPVPAAMIKAVKKQISIPLMVGGGIRTPQEAFAACHAGADAIVVGNAAEKDASVLFEIKKAVHETRSYQLS